MARFIRTCGRSGAPLLSNCGASRWINCSFTFRMHSLSGSRGMRLLVVGLALLAASCGASGNTPVGEPASTTTSSTASSVPRLIVSPSTDLVGGQQLQVSIAGFPHDATVKVYQCASAASVTHSNTCSGPIFLYTASSGGASGPFIAQPSVGGAQSRTTCQDQCVLVGMVIKEGAKVPPSPAPMATSTLSFSTTGTPGLKDAFLQDLSWISTTEGWAMASQPCATGLCVRLANTTDGGVAYTVSGTLWNRANGGSWVLIYPPYRAIDVSHGSGRTVALTVEGRLLQISSKASASFATLGNFGINGGDASLVPGATVMLTPSTFEVLKSSAKQWSNQPLPKGWSVLSGRFATSKIGALVLGPPGPELEATLSGGKSWTKIPLPFSAFSVDPLSATNWWLAGGISHPLVPNPYNKKILIWKYYLYHTTDAGRTWSQFGANWPGMGSLNGVQFISSSVGYTWNENTIFVTTNGGKTFVGHQLSAYYIPGPSSLAVGTGGRAWLASDSYPVFESKDYGSTWSPM